MNCRIRRSWAARSVTLKLSVDYNSFPCFAVGFTRIQKCLILAADAFVAAWLIHFLNPDCYYGIEPNADMLNAGINAFLDREILEAKRPRFAHNPNFDPSGFGSSFDFFIARSIWTHSSKNQIEAMLDSFVKHGAEDSVFLASYLPSADDGYTGEGWVGRSHESNVGGMVGHGFAWIQQKCAIRGLRVAELPVDRIRQIWLMVCKGNGCAPITHWLRELFA